MESYLATISTNINRTFKITFKMLESLKVIQHMPSFFSWCSSFILMFERRRSAVRSSLQKESKPSASAKLRTLVHSRTRIAPSGSPNVWYFGQSSSFSSRIHPISWFQLWISRKGRKWTIFAFYKLIKGFNCFRSF